MLEVLKWGVLVSIKSSFWTSFEVTFCPCHFLVLLEFVREQALQVPLALWNNKSEHLKYCGVYTLLYHSSVLFLELLHPTKFVNMQKIF